MKIFLLGLSGSGKSTLGKQLAKALDVSFVDLDADIEKAEGKSVQKIFAEKKEDYFRKIESAQLKKWCKSDSAFVMGTGGGTPIFFDNIKLINASGISIFLDVPASEIVKRIISTDLAERPLFAKAHPENIKDQVEFMRSHRLPFYKQALHTLTGSAIDVSQLINLVRKGNPA